MTLRISREQYTCLFWDCDIPIRADHFFCYNHYLDLQDGLINKCPDCGRAKSTEYEVCFDCSRYEQLAWDGKGEVPNTPASTSRASLSSEKRIYHVGVSFAGEDRAPARRLVQALKAVGLDVFFDE